MTNRIYMIVLSILNVLTSFLLILQVYLFRNIIDNAVNHISLKQDQSDQCYQDYTLLLTYCAGLTH